MIDNHKRKLEPTLSATLALMGIVSALGLVYCLLMLLSTQTAPYSRSDVLLSGAWFAAAAISVIAIVRWKKWGVYLLGVATLLMSAVNILQGTATWGGASLAMIIAAVLCYYLWPRWGYFE